MCIIQDLTQKRIQEELTIEKNTAEQSAKFKDQFLANMSHEIKTPMNGIIGMVDILQRSVGLNPKQKSHLKIIQNSSRDLMNIINDILDLSKLQAGKVEIKYSETSIKDVVHHVSSLFSANAAQKGLSINTIHTSNIPLKFNAPTNRITQILSNLVGNAVKLTSFGSVTIKTSWINKDDGMMKIEITDTGNGISIENQKLLFNDFHQLDQSITKANKGTGLGLAISKKLVELMQGEVGIISEIGKGSNFWFTFKTTPIEEPTDQPSEPNPNSEQTQNYDLKVLLIDDNAVKLMVAEIMLEEFECEVTSATNGLDGLEKFEENLFDLILMDIQMPEMNGAEASQKIKKKYAKVPPIIGLSANAMEGDAEKIHEPRIG
ncbi:MAG: response regulator [Flavobacteriales bacterium]|nr:response regulator [Flavobacteriales bacterium]